MFTVLRRGARPATGTQPRSCGSPAFGEGRLRELVKRQEPVTSAAQQTVIAEKADFIRGPRPASPPATLLRSLCRCVVYLPRYLDPADRATLKER